MPFHHRGLCMVAWYGGVFAQTSLLLGWWMTLAYPPLLWFAPCRGPTGSPHLPSTNAFVRPLLPSFHSTPPWYFLPLPHFPGLPSPPPSASPSSSSLATRRVSLASSLLPPARSFYFSFIFPTREPSRCNLHPSCCCCCCRRPSRLPRATIGVEIVRLARENCCVSGKKILLILIEIVSDWYELILYYTKHESITQQRLLQISPINGHYCDCKFVMVI